MPFIRSASPRYFAPAQFPSLDEEGRLVTSKFDCQFKRLKHSELAQLQADVQKWAGDVGAAVRKSAMDAARRVLAAEEAEPGAVEAAAEDALAATPSAALSIGPTVQRRVLGRVMTGWRAVQDKDGADIPFSYEALDGVEEEFPGFVNACAAAFWNSCAPTEAAHLAAKN